MTHMSTALKTEGKTGFARVYVGKRSIGTVRKADFRVLWIARDTRGKVVGHASTRANAAKLLTK